jgi:cell division septation protein DedD
LELARLIGQTEPFAPAPRANEARKPDARAVGVSFNAPSPDRGIQDRAALNRPPARDAVHSQERSHQERSHQERSHQDGSHEDRSFGGGSFEDRAADRSDLLQPSSRDEYPVAPRQGRAYKEDYDHEDSSMADRPPVYGPDDEYTGEYLEDESEHDGDYEYEAEDEHSDDGESDVKRRGTTKIVIAVLGLAVFGSAAAFGYRTVFKAAPSGPTPIIRADTSPTKVMPAAADVNPKPVNERVSDISSERLVRRDEDPVDVGTTYRSMSGDTGRSISGDAGASGPLADTTGLPPATVPAAGGLPSPNDPKPVRTVPIRTDPGSASASPERTALPNRTAPPDRVAPLDRAASRPVPPSPSPPRQVAALPAPPSTNSAPAIAAPEPANPRAVEGGGFVVQLTAQRSEADAQASFRTMQAKYSVLNGRQPLIRRKEVGEKGIFYAAQVGPFGAKSEADQLCEALKSAGGTCFVQKN